VGGETNAGGKAGLAGDGATTAPPGTAYGETVGGWLDQMNSRSPDGSIRGPCQLAQPAIMAHIPTANATKLTRVVNFANISLKAFHADGYVFCASTLL
jgi:hypothetical protein